MAVSGGAAYDVLVGLHVAAALVGFGSVALSGVYGVNARRAGDVRSGRQPAAWERTPGTVPPASTPLDTDMPDTDLPDTEMEELRRYFGSAGRLEWALLAVPVFGILAVLVGPGSGALAQVWVGLGFGLWVLAAGLLLGVVRPAEARLRQAVAAPAPAQPPAAPAAPAQPPAPAPAPVLVRSGRALAWASAACDGLFVVALLVMVIKPGA